MLFLYMLLLQIPTETRDPYTKDQCGFSLVLHVFGQVITTVLEWLMVIVAINVLADGLVPADVKCCLTEYLINGLMILVPGICLLLTGLIHIGLMVEM